MQEFLKIHVLVQIWSIKLAISEGMKWIMYAIDHENSMTLRSSMWFRFRGLKWFRGLGLGSRV
jgi:hypothetical protein